MEVQHAEFSMEVTKLPHPLIIYQTPNQLQGGSKINICLCKLELSTQRLAQLVNLVVFVLLSIFNLKSSASHSLTTMPHFSMIM